MREGGVPKGTANVYAAQVAALAGAGQLTAGVSQSVGAKAYAAAREAKRAANTGAEKRAAHAAALTADAACRIAARACEASATPADAATAEPKPDVIVLSGGLTAGMLPPAVDGVIRLDPTACAAMLRAVGWTVYAPGEAPVQTAPVRPRKSAVKA